MRVMRFSLDNRFSRITHTHTIERAHPDFNEPTMGVLTPDNHFYYIANSPWSEYTKDFNPITTEKVGNIVILRTSLRK